MAKKKPNAPKKITKKKQQSLARTKKRKSLSDWSKAVRDRDNNMCAVCSHTEHLNAHHILPKENYKELMYEIINGITLCPSHHKFSKYSAHKNAIWFYDFLKKNKEAQLEWALKNL